MQGADTAFYRASPGRYSRARWRNWYAVAFLDVRPYAFVTDVSQIERLRETGT